MTLMLLMCKMPIAFAFAMAFWCGACAQAIKRAVLAFDFASVDEVLEQESCSRALKYPVANPLQGPGGL